MRTSTALASFLAMLVLQAGETSAETRSILVSGTASGNGMVDIIIEDNDSPNRELQERRALYEIDVTILNGSPAIMSALSVRDTLDAELPPFYDVKIFQDSTVVITQLGEIVNFNVTDDVPGQTFVDATPPGGTGTRAPVGPIAMALGAAGMCVAAVRRLRRR